MTATRSGSATPMPYVESFTSWLNERVTVRDEREDRE